MAILNDPTRVDPWGAAVLHMLTNARRALRRSEQRCTQFVKSLAGLKAKQKDDFAQGPAHAIARALVVIGVSIAEKMSTKSIILIPSHGPSINLLTCNTRALKRNVTMWVRQAFLQKLSDDCNDTKDPRRKDMVGITRLVDRNATCANFSSKREHHPYKADKLLRNTLNSVITGAIRTADRAHAAKMIESDVCPCPSCKGARSTAEHCFDFCEMYGDLRKKIR